jgi:two-component system, OmpR family, response regulator
VDLRILVVDDDPQILKLFARILTKGGYLVRTEGSSQKAIELALDASEPIDLVVLDLSMPAPDGFEVLKALRAQRPGLRILVTSGFMAGAFLEAAKLLGATDSLNKQDAPDLLLRKVSQLLQR